MRAQELARRTREQDALKSEGTVPPMPPGAFVKEEGTIPPMPPDADVKVEIVVKQEEGAAGGCQEHA